jgi:hypothetical protein
MIKVFGYFNADVGESVEMLYQYQYPYHFSSAKFEKYFNYTPVSHAAGLEETIKFYQRTV